MLLYKLNLKKDAENFIKKPIQEQEKNQNSVLSTFKDYI